jgi:hypothetical protein
MRAVLLISMLALGILGETTNRAECNNAILKQLNNGRLFSDTLNLNGKYLNELGNYETCTKIRNDTKYFLNIYKSKKEVNITQADGGTVTIKPFQLKLVMGACTFRKCEKDSLAAFDFFYI